ncbi:MAG: glycosyltransferase, partial [Ignavibacteria bacterium]|nr:glycosyltransferase [Ignavibacteria bacterium]
MIDVLITTYNRKELLKKTVESFLSKNKKLPYRLFIVDDFSTDGTVEYLLDLRSRQKVNLLFPASREGITHGFNALWSWINHLDIWYEENPYLCYLQDDVLSVEEEWLLKILSAYEELKDKYNIGFFSGHHAIEHPVEKTIKWNGSSFYLKKSNSGQNMIAEKSFWRSIGSPPRLNPDGSMRGFPNHGKGSCLDI